MLGGFWDSPGALPQDPFANWIGSPDRCGGNFGEVAVLFEGI